MQNTKYKYGIHSSIWAHVTYNSPYDHHLVLVEAEQQGGWRMESHHPTELGVVKRVRMEGVRVTFFVLTVAIEAISTMEILVSRLVMGTMTGFDVCLCHHAACAPHDQSDGHGVPPYGHNHGPHDYPGHQNLYGADGLYGCFKMEECYPSFLPSLPRPALLDYDFPSSILLAALRHM